MTGDDTHTATPRRRATHRMKIGGMSCSFCTSTIDKALSRIDGVDKVGVSLAHEEGLVTYDPDRVRPGQLRRTLEELGYTTRDPDKVAAFEDQARELHQSRDRLLVAGAATLVSLLMMVLGAWLGVVSIPAMPWIALGLAVVTMFGPAWFVKRMAWDHCVAASSTSTCCSSSPRSPGWQAGCSACSSRPAFRPRTSSPWPCSSPPTTCCPTTPRMWCGHARHRPLAN